MQEKLKNTKGITLVALIITVIILLILAGVTISLLIGDNGMLTKTKQGVEKSEMASIKEKAELVRNEQGIRNFEENPQELTKSSYINALNVSFEDSIVEGSRVIVKDKKYAIFVKSNLEVEVIKNDGKTLAEGEMKLDYTVSEEGLIEIYPRIGGVESYKIYAEKILEGKTQEEVAQIFVDGQNYWNEVYEGGEPTYSNIEELIIYWSENYCSEPISNIEELCKAYDYNNLNDFAISWQYVKPEGYDFENNKYNEIEIECPNGNKLVTDTDTLCVTYKVYQKGEYKFIGSVTEGEYKETTAEVIVPVTIDLPQLKDDEANPELQSMKLKINVTEDNKTIELPVYQYTDENYAYDCTVNWGDGTTEQVTNENAKNTKHTYETTGEYTVVIEGVYEILECNSSIEKALKKVEQWGATGLKEIYLNYCKNLETIAEPSKNSFVNVTSFYRTFEGCSNLISIPERLFANCPNVTSFYCTFYGCSNLTGKSIHLWEEGRIGINGGSGGLGCYDGCIKLNDYTIIPTRWKYCPPN